MSKSQAAQPAFYAVLSLDIMGQTAALQGWSRAPMDAAGKRTFDESFDATAVRVLKARDHFQTLAERAQEQYRQQGAVFQSAGNLQGASIWHWYANPALCHATYSDGLVFWVKVGELPLIGAPSSEILEPNAKGLVDLTAIASGGMLDQLKQGVLMRGAIHVGIGCEISDGRSAPAIYGPVHACAYHLESRAADFPRVLVSEEAMAFLNRATAAYPNGPQQMIQRAATNGVRSLVSTCPVDGRNYVDWWSAAVQSPQASGAIQSVKAWIQSERSKYLRDPKLFRKYGHLLAHTR